MVIPLVNLSMDYHIVSFLSCSIYFKVVNMVRIILLLTKQALNKVLNVSKEYSFKASSSRVVGIIFFKKKSFILSMNVNLDLVSF